MRLAHTDIQIPDFSNYRRQRSPQESKDENIEKGKMFTYLMVGGKASPLEFYIYAIIPVHIFGNTINVVTPKI